MEKGPSLYEILGVPTDADLKTIRKAYRSKAMQHHPDRHASESSDEDNDQHLRDFQEVQNAYEVLSDRERRELYDLSGEVPKPRDALEEEARSFLIKSYASALTQMATLVTENPGTEHMLRSPVSVISETISDKLQQAHSEASAARKVRDNLQRFQKRLHNQDGLVEAVSVALENPLREIAARILHAENGRRMLEIAAQLNSNWDWDLEPDPGAGFASIALTLYESAAASRSA